MGNEQSGGGGGQYMEAMLSMRVAKEYEEKMKSLGTKEERAAYKADFEAKYEGVEWLDENDDTKYPWNGARPCNIDKLREDLVELGLSWMKILCTNHGGMVYYTVEDLEAYRAASIEKKGVDPCEIIGAGAVTDPGVAEEAADAEKELEGEGERKREGELEGEGKREGE